MTAEPLSVRLAGEVDEEKHALAARSNLAVSLIVGALLGLVLMPFSLLASDELRLTMWVLAVTLAPLLMQDTCRFVAIVQGRPAVAAVNDLCWVALQCASLGYLIYTDSTSPALYLLAWATSGALCSLIGLVQLRHRPSTRGVVYWLRSNRDLWPRFLAEATFSNGARQSVLWMSGLFVGASGAGALRGAQLLMGPIRVVLMGIMSAGVAEGVRAAGGDPLLLRRVVRRASVVLAFAASVWVVILLVLPESWGVQLLGTSWSAASEVMLPVGIMWIGTAFITASTVGLRVLANARASLAARTVEVIALVGLAFIGGLIGDLSGIAWGMGAGSLIGSFTWFLLFERAVRRRTLTDRASLLDNERVLSEGVSKS